MSQRRDSVALPFGGAPVGEGGGFAHSATTRCTLRDASATQAEPRLSPCITTGATGTRALRSAARAMPRPRTTGDAQALPVAGDSGTGHAALPCAGRISRARVGPADARSFCHAPVPQGTESQGSSPRLENRLFRRGRLCARKARCRMDGGAGRSRLRQSLAHSPPGRPLARRDG